MKLRILLSTVLIAACGKAADYEAPTPYPAAGSATSTEKPELAKDFAAPVQGPAAEPLTAAPQPSQGMADKGEAFGIADEVGLVDDGRAANLRNLKAQNGQDHPAGDAGKATPSTVTGVLGGEIDGALPTQPGGEIAGHAKPVDALAKSLGGTEGYAFDVREQNEPVNGDRSGTEEKEEASEKTARERKSPTSALDQELEANIEGKRDGDGIEDDDTVRVARGAFLPTHGDDTAFARPETTLPRVFYFENTYLGGSAAYQERLRRLNQALTEGDRHYELVKAEAQPFDAPHSEGLGLSASLDVSHFDRARRVFLQIGIQGSSRYGWRRPPLDLVLVLDGPTLDQGQAFLSDFVAGLLRQLGPADRLGLVVAGQTKPFLELSRLDSAQQHLAARIGELARPAQAQPALSNAMALAGSMLSAASDDEAIVPGSQTVLVLTAGETSPELVAAARAAHALTLQGAVTSVFALGSAQGDWWQVANAGHGNLHRIAPDSFEPALRDEMASLARVVARLVRLNIRLGKDVEAVRVLGTRVLAQDEVEDLKARELAVDRSLSRSLGITSDRGEDDDGIQTVIPYFYGDDSHVILIELWVEGPGTVADVTMRYKDMVNLDNATARTSVRLDLRPRPPTREQALIAKNVRGALLAETLQTASDAVERNDAARARVTLGTASAMARETNALDQRAVDALLGVVEQGAWQNDSRARAMLKEQLLISGQRRVGDTGQLGR